MADRTEFSAWASVCVAAAVGLAVSAAPAVAEETEPARLWMWGSVEKPPPTWKYGERTFFHGDRQISISEFVRIGGYPDLADRMENRRRLRYTLMASGILIAAGGGAWAITAPACELVGREECEAARNSRQNRGMLIVVGGLAVFGGTTLLLPNIRPPYSDLRRIEQDYNRKLQVTPVVTTHGAELHAQLRF